jgi:hypothetical protein
LNIHNDIKIEIKLFYWLYFLLKFLEKKLGSRFVNEVRRRIITMVSLQKMDKTRIV